MWSELVLQSGRSLRCCCFFFLFFFCGVILLYAFPFVGLSALFVLLLSLECFLSLYLGFLVLFSFHFLCFFVSFCWSCLVNHCAIVSGLFQVLLVCGIVCIYPVNMACCLPFWCLGFCYLVHQLIGGLRGENQRRESQRWNVSSNATALLITFHINVHENGVLS